MIELTDRYEPVLDPDEDWTVWDNALQEPAMDGSEPLAGLSFEAAEAACRALNSPRRPQQGSYPRAA